MRLLHDLEPCSPAETARHVAYLRDTPMASVADDLARGRLALAKARVGSREALGEVSTCWEELGGLRARDRVGRGRFLVREALAALQDPDCDDSEALGKVAWRVADWASAQDGARATLLYEHGGFTVLDWNKRTVAFHTRAGRRGEEAIDFPVYVVHRAGERVPEDAAARPPAMRAGPA